MALDKKYYVHTTHDGILGDTTTADIDALVTSLAPAARVALVLHGGLVSKEAALATAEGLLPAFLNAGVHPVFFVWETGPLETFRNILENVWSEDLFKSIVKKLLQHVAAKVAEQYLSGARDAVGLPILPNDLEVAREYQKLNRSEEPFGDISPVRTTRAPSKEEIRRLEDDLRNDPRFVREVEAAARWIEDERDVQSGVPATARLPEGPAKKTLADPDAMLEPMPADSAPGTARARGFFTASKAVWSAVQAFGRVISRYQEARDHGVYATVVEEVLRQFYGTNVGSTVWGTMKRQAKAAFSEPQHGQVRGGWYLCEKLGTTIRGGLRPQVSVIGHSAGAIYACHLLDYVHQTRGRVFPADFVFKNLVLMAPACSFGMFDTVCAAQPPLFENFRLYALKDELESGYWEVPLLYPRSLLYLVAGAFEKEADGETGAYDLPLLGMERYHKRPQIYKQDEIVRVRQFLAATPPCRQVWCINAGAGPGLDADSKRHGGFFLDEQQSPQPTQVMRSVLHVIQNGV